MARKILGSILAVTAGAAWLSAQTETAPGQSNLSAVGAQGLRFENASLFVTHFSVGNGGYLPVTAGANVLGGETQVGASATVGYLKSGERSSFSLIYTPSYTEQVDYLQERVSNHALSMNWMRRLTPRLSLTLSASGVLASISQSAFVPDKLTALAAVPGTPDEFSNAVITGTATNGQLAAALNGVSAVNSPAALLIYGSRSLLASVQATISYSYSPRLRFHFGVGGNRSQNLNDPNVPQNVYWIAHSTAVSGDVGMDYLLSPLTRISFDVSANRAVSSFEDGYYNSGSVTLAHSISTKWVVQLQGGAGFIVAERQFYKLPGGAQYLGGGSISYKTRSHTFIASLTRSFGDSYALGATGSLAASGAWSWRRPGSPWLVAATFSDQRWTGPNFPMVNSWSSRAGVTRKLGAHMAVAADYIYLSNLNALGSLAGTIQGQHVMRFSMLWIPGVEVR